MKRALAALAALCLLAGSASAKGLVIIADTKNNSSLFASGMRPLENMFVSTLNGMGADFDVIRADQLVGNPAFNAQVDSYLRHGKVWRNGMGFVTATGESLVTQYNPVIHLGFSSSDANMTTSTSNSRYKADSLTLVRYYPTVTHLFVGNPNHTANEFNISAGRCSAGVGAKRTYTAADDSLLNAYEIGNPGRTWKSYVRFLALGTRSPRGWRPILGSVSTRRNEVGAQTNNYDYPDPVTGAANGCAYSTNPDSIGGLWVINNTDATGAPIGGNAKPMIFCSPARLFTSSDFDMGIVLTAIAMADSFSNGGLLGSSTKLPAKIGIHIDDGWKRGDSNGGPVCGGIAWTDTTAFKATVDSLAALSVPFVVGVEVDSITTYAGYDDRWWSRAPMAHFTPHCHSGVGSPGAGFLPRTQNVSTKFLNVIDQWGIVRTRYAFGSVDSALAYGLTDYVNDVADSASTYWLTKRAFALLDSTFGNARVDHFVMPPGDDWSNSQVKHSTSVSGNAVDSCLTAAALAGASGVRSNAYSTFSAVVQSPNETNHYGYYINQQPWTVSASGSPAWVPVSRYGTSADVMSCYGYPTTSTPLDLSLAHASALSWSRHIRGTVGDHQWLLRGMFSGVPNEAVWAGSATRGENVKANIFALHVGDLGSRQPMAGGELTRPGFYALKYLVHSVNLANAHARQPLIVFAYPEEMKP